MIFVYILAEPREYMDGTQLRVPPDPWGLILGYPEFTLAEPSPGVRQFRQISKMRQPRVFTRNAFSKFFENT